MADQPISEKVILSAQVPASQRDQLARLAAEHDRPLSYVVRAALNDYLEREAFSATSSRAPAGASGSQRENPDVDELRVGLTFARFSPPDCWQSGSPGTFLSLERTSDGQLEATGVFEQDEGGNIRPSRSLAIAKPLVRVAPLPRLDRALVVRVRQAARERRPRQGRRRTSRVASGSDPPQSDDDPEPPLTRFDGVAVAARRMHVHLCRRTGTRKAAA